MTNLRDVSEIFNDVQNGVRLSAEDAVALLKSADTLTLSKFANEFKLRKKGELAKLVTFVIDRNINYTNICATACSFCAFYRIKGSDEGYIISNEELTKKIDETKALGGTQILLQGGQHPDLKIDYYEELTKFITDQGMWLHGFSASEIFHIAKVSKINYQEVIDRLRAVGLKSIPGAADLLVESVRKEVSPTKVSVQDWCNIMYYAHTTGMRTSATMMFKAEDSFEDIVSHLKVIRDLQDRTSGFTAFICWPFQPGNTKLEGRKASAVEYLRILSVARLFLDNIDNVQASWVTQGAGIGQLSLFYGANDFGSLMIEENVVRSANTSFQMSIDDIVNHIVKAGFRPAQRDMHYNILRYFD